MWHMYVNESTYFTNCKKELTNLTVCAHLIRNDGNTGLSYLASSQKKQADLMACAREKIRKFIKFKSRD
jgi:hypothetical protein